MTVTEALRIVKGQTPDCSKAETTSAWQLLVDNGMIWDMTPHYARLAACMIEAGVLKRNPA